jgi:Fe-Mn family superoxide dismutase
MAEIAEPAIALPPLPYALDALEPHLSRETLEMHYGRHHATYVATLNEMLAGTEPGGLSLEDTLMTAGPGALFDTAAQVWNHGFFWNCLTPRHRAPSPALRRQLDAAFGSVEAFQARFTRVATRVFGSGWAWLVRDSSGALRIVATRNAGLPMTANQVALLTCDVWEHAYYLDHRNDRGEYLKHFWQLVNWDFVAACLWAPWEWSSARREATHDPADEASMESFPASDPPASSPTRAGPPSRRKEE